MITYSTKGLTLEQRRLLAALRDDRARAAYVARVRSEARTLVTP